MRRNAPPNSRHTLCIAFRLTETTQERCVVAVYDSHTAAKTAVKELRKAGLETKI